MAWGRVFQAGGASALLRREGIPAAQGGWIAGDLGHLDDRRLGFDPEEVRVLFGGWWIHEESLVGAMGTPRRSRGPVCEAKVRGDWGSRLQGQRERSRPDQTQ